MFGRVVQRGAIQGAGAKSQARCTFRYFERDFLPSDAVVCREDDLKRQALPGFRGRR